MALWLHRQPTVTVFMTNFCLMTLELAAGRLIAPYVGVSLYTWTAVIGIVLAGMTMGNYLGGKLADRWPSARLVGVALLAAGAFSVLSLVVLGLAGESVTGQGVPYVLAVMVITSVFFFPSMMLGVVSPVIAKLTVLDLRTTGATVGKIYAAAALGSIAGTYATGFWLISLLGVRAIILLVSAVLLMLAVGYLDLEGWRWLDRRQRAWLAALAVVLAGSLAVILREPLCQQESNYYCIRVDTGASGKIKILRLDRLVHSYSNVHDPTQLLYAYERLFAALYEYSRPPEPRVLFLGGGGYTLPRYLVHRYGSPRAVVAEIDPAVSETAFAEFDMPRDSTVTTVNADARMYLKNLPDEERYDFIIGDVFSDFSIPYHLTTREFSQMLRQHLAPDGLYAANVIDTLEPGLFVTSYLRTLDSVFAYELV